jgi:hypothetical protein
MMTDNLIKKFIENMKPLTWPIYSWDVNWRDKITEENWQGKGNMDKCSECGYPCTETEYHPYEYCVLVKAGIDPEEFIQQEIKRTAPDVNKSDCC